MLINRNTWAAHRNWFVLTIVVAALSTIWYLWEARSMIEWPGGSSRPGLVLGIAAAAIIIFELLLWPRKRLRGRRLGRAQTWLRAHIWLGLLCVPLVVLHSGGSLGSQLTVLLSVVFAVVIASGLWGLALQQFLPTRMLQQVPAETVYLEIDELSARNCEDARELVRAVCGADLVPVESDDAAQSSGGTSHIVIDSYRTMGRTRGKVLRTRALPSQLENCGALASTYLAIIEPYLRSGSRGGRSLLEHESSAAQLFRDLRIRLPSEAHTIGNELEELCRQRRQYDLQIKLHHWLHGWLLIHAPLSVMLTLLLMLHIYVSIKYW